MMMNAEDTERYQQAARRAGIDGQLVRVWPLAGGISADMTGLAVEVAGGGVHRLVLRRMSAAARPGALAGEHRVLRAARANGLSVPEVLLFDDSGEVFPGAYLVTEFIDGEMVFAPADLEGYLRQMAEQLAQIHRVDADAAGLAFLPQTGAMEEPARLDELDLPFDLSRVIGALKSAWPIPQRNPVRLLHGDYWPGNVLWRDGRLAAVIDWEDAHTGDPLLDLAGCRMELAWIFDMAAAEHFGQLYLERMPLNSAALPYWELLAALRMAQWAFPDLEQTAAFFAPYGRTDITPKTVWENIGRFVEQALDRISK